MIHVGQNSLIGDFGTGGGKSQGVAQVSTISVSRYHTSHWYHWNWPNSNHSIHNRPCPVPTERHTIISAPTHVTRCRIDTVIDTPSLCVFGRLRIAAGPGCFLFALKFCDGQGQDGLCTRITVVKGQLIVNLRANLFDMDINASNLAGSVKMVWMQIDPKSPNRQKGTGPYDTFVRDKAMTQALVCNGFRPTSNGS